MLTTVVCGPWWRSGGGTGRKLAFNLSSQDSGSQEFARQFPFFLRLLHLAEVIILILSIFKALVVRNLLASSRSFFIEILRIQVLRSSSWPSTVALTKGKYFQDNILFEIMLFLPTSTLPFAKLALLYVAVTAGMLTILASPLPQASDTEEAQGLACYLVVVQQNTYGHRVHVGITKQILIGVKYENTIGHASLTDSIAPGHLANFDVVGKPSFIDPDSLRDERVIWIPIGRALIEEDKVKPIAKEVMDKTKAKSFVGEGNDFLYSLDFIMNFEEMLPRKTKLDHGEIKKQLFEYCNSVVHDLCMNQLRQEKKDAVIERVAQIERAFLF
ncbi:hypothetical protein F5878DRAFT_641618 [Lentinula raphanica]|uniref:Uncharacterized protein n=1 Tax=Lentinula raphanica TaxID=153919 RepID=A0AA38P9L5_9AGAR|nr:hypothetical protein F5878DRAFT_641618 [Lentinula raphanica]